MTVRTVREEDERMNQGNCGLTVFNTAAADAASTEKANVAGTKPFSKIAVEEVWRFVRRRLVQHWVDEMMVHRLGYFHRVICSAS